MLQERSENRIPLTEGPYKLGTCMTVSECKGTALQYARGQHQKTRTEAWRRPVRIIHEIEGAVLRPLVKANAGLLVGSAKQEPFPLVAVAAREGRAASVGHARDELVMIYAFRQERLDNGVTVRQYPIRMEIQGDPGILSDTRELSAHRNGVFPCFRKICSVMDSVLFRVLAANDST